MILKRMVSCCLALLRLAYLSFVVHTLDSRRCLADFESRLGHKQKSLLGFICIAWEVLKGVGVGGVGGNLLFLFSLHIFRAAKALRAKGTLISEPRFSTPCELRFFPREKGKMAFVEGFSLKRPFSLSRVGKIASRGGEKIGAH